MHNGFGALLSPNDGKCVFYSRLLIPSCVAMRYSCSISSILSSQGSCRLSGVAIRLSAIYPLSPLLSTCGGFGVDSGTSTPQNNKSKSRTQAQCSDSIVQLYDATQSGWEDILHQVFFTISGSRRRSRKVMSTDDTTEAVRIHIHR